MKLFYIITVVCLIIIGGGYLALSLVNSPRTQTLPTLQRQKMLNEILGRPVMTQNTNAPAGYLIYSGKYLSFNYPRSAIIYHGNDKNIIQNKLVLESFEFDQKMPNINFIIQVLKRNETDMLSSLPEVLFRQSHAYEYKSKAININSLNCMEFIKSNDGVEYSAFCLANNKEFSIVASGSDQSTISSLFNKTISSISLFPK